MGPSTGLTPGGDGNFCGVTGGGDDCGRGTVFQFTAGGMLNTLHSFDQTDGTSPMGRLVQTGNGTLYGTTQS